MKKVFSFIISILITVVFVFTGKIVDVNAVELNNSNPYYESSNVELLDDELQDYLDLYKDELILCDDNIYSFNLLKESFQNARVNISRTSNERKSYFFPVYYNPYTGEYIGFYLYYYEDEVFTPNGFSIDTIRHDSEIPDEYIEIFDEQVDSSTMNVQRIQSATAYFNCHSYAWYSQNRSTNKMWIDYPDQYYDILDLSYIRVYNPQKNDIICYYDMNAEEGKRNLHSGIITEVFDVEANSSVYGTNKYLIESKWGYNGLYSHVGDQCPYMPNFGGTTTEVRYYRPRTNATYSLTNPLTNTPQMISTSYSVPVNSNNTNNYAMYELNVNYMKYYDFYLTSDYELDVRLYDAHMQQVTINEVLNNYNVSIHKSLSVGRYYLRVAYQDSNSSGTIALQIISEHTHNHGSPYVWQNYTQHSATCSCGNTQIQPHIVAEGSFQNGEQYATCLLCGGLAEIGFVGPDGLSRGSFSTITASGSYILPNGVIVLVDEDVSKFMNGTLSFNDYLLYDIYPSNNQIVMYNPRDDEEWKCLRSQR